MLQYIKDKAKWILAGLVTLMVVILMIVSLTYAFGYKERILSMAEERAGDLATKDSEAVEDFVDNTLDFVTSVSLKASKIAGEDDMYLYLRDLCISPERTEGMTDEEYEKLKFLSPKTIRVYKAGKFYTASQHKEYFSEDALVRAGVQDIAEVKMLGIEKDVEYGMNLLAVAAPLIETENGDAIVIYYAPDMFNYCTIEDTEGVFVAIARDDGTISNLLKNSLPGMNEPGNVDKLLELIGDTDKKNVVSKNFGEAKDFTQSIDIDGIDYIVSAKHVSTESSSMRLVAVYKMNDIYGNESSYYSNLVSIIVLFSVTIVAAMIYVAVTFIRKKIISLRELWNETYNCNTHGGFVKAGKAILEQHKVSKFAVVIAEIRFFKRLFAKEETVSRTLARSVVTVVQKFTERFECFGYDGSGTFYLLFHMLDEKSLIERLMNLDRLCSKFKIDADKRMTLLFGISYLDENNHDLVKGLDNAATALLQTKAQVGLRNYTVYVPKEEVDTLDKEYVELNAEKAINEGDFKVFYQPKYNIAKNTVDGAEALMRWFIPSENRFYPPAAFLPVIENNGFIVRVDHYVFEKVCKYIRRALDTGENIYPISVNVSRFTIMQEDFVEYYSSMKKQYKIRNGLITIEFTESEDVQDYGFMKRISEELRQAGFMCSIDDFGTGFASYDCLKELCLDEIKLDRTFIKSRLQDPKEVKIVKSVIDLGKELGLKVTCEGVSDEDVYQKLKEYGCEIIQGFLYAKPMPTADYVAFINSPYKGAFH